MNELSPRAKKILEERNRKGVFPLDEGKRWLRRTVINRPRPFDIPSDLFGMPPAPSPQCDGKDRDCFECARLRSMELGMTLTFEEWDALMSEREDSDRLSD